MTTALPIIVGFGGISSAGRSSSHHAFNRISFDATDNNTQQKTLQSLAQLMNLDSKDLDSDYILKHSLLRQIEQQHFATNAVPYNKKANIQGSQKPTSLRLRTKHLPKTIPSHWQVTAVDAENVDVVINGDQNVLLPTHRDFEVKAASQLPTGFEPGKLYPSRNHPRGLQMAIYAASDALNSMGISWDAILEQVAVDQVSTYGGSAMGQLDPLGSGGMLKSRLQGGKVSSKHCALGLAQMPADFINAYVLGSLGQTGASMGACASFLYNLRHAIDDIKNKRARVAVVISSEAPILPEVIDGYLSMGALATDKNLRILDGLTEDQAIDYARACRPFGNNCGFSIAESSQVLVLFDDALAMQLGAALHGSVGDIFVNADGFKKSISGPGVGNYITFARATALAQSLLQEQQFKNGGHIQAHGTGTPQNRTTESVILSSTAKAFGINHWNVSAVKSYVGHSLGSASADQIINSLGVWSTGILPGIHSVNETAEDVITDRLNFSQQHQQLDKSQQFYSIINSKGFGGNNASATVFSPLCTEQLLKKRYSAKTWEQWQQKNERVQQTVNDTEASVLSGQHKPDYYFDHNVLNDQDVAINANKLTIGKHSISLQSDSPYSELNLK